MKRFAAAIVIIFALGQVILPSFVVQATINTEIVHQDEVEEGSESDSISSEEDLKASDIGDLKYSTEKRVQKSVYKMSQYDPNMEKEEFADDINSMQNIDYLINKTDSKFEIALAFEDGSYSYFDSTNDINDAIKRIVPNEFKDTWQQLDNPLYAFKKITKGPKIKKPKHIFFIVGESIPQWSLDETHKLLNICPGLWNFKSQSHTVQIPNFLPAGNVSRPSIVSLMSGIYDAGLEINERESFWKGVFPTSFAHQMKRLGYQTIYWYGGNASYGNFNHFGKAQGFDRVESASIFCGPDAPKTWVGVYDHVFLENIEQQIKSINEPTFHFIYTTSNHGPYKMEDSLLDYDPEKVMPDVGEDLRSNKTRNKELATYRYSDKAIFTFVEAMKKAFPDSLFIVTGDHSNLFGSLNNTSLIRRDYTLRDTFCTVALLQHPDLNQDMIVSSKGTHMSLMPTIIEAIAPKGFEYYSIAPSLFEDQPETLVTPYQWITDSLIGDVRGDYGESNVATTEPVEPVRPIDNHADNARDWTLLTMWLINHRG